MAQQPKHLPELWQSDLIKNWTGAPATAVRQPQPPQRGVLYIGEDPPNTKQRERISTGDKGGQIEGLIEPLVPDPIRRKDFGKWLAKVHGGLEHDHFPYLNNELVETVRQWQGEGALRPDERAAREKWDTEHPRRTAGGDGSSRGGGSGGGASGADDHLSPRERAHLDAQEIQFMSKRGPQYMTRGQYRQRVEEAREWMEQEKANQAKEEAQGSKKPAKKLTPEQLAREAAGKFGLDEGWHSPANEHLRPYAPPPKPAGSPPTPSTKGPDLHQRVVDLQQRVAAVTHAALEAEKMLTDIQKKQNNRQSPSEVAKLDEESKALKKKTAAVRGELDDLGKKIAADPELAPHKGSSVKETLKNAKGKLPSGSHMAGTVIKVLDAIDTLEDVSNILDANNVLDGLSRTGKFAAGAAVGAAEIGLMHLVTRSGPFAAAAVMFFNNLRDGSMPTEAERAAQAKTEAEAKQVGEEHLAVIKFMAEHYPGSAFVADGAPIVVNHKLYQATLKKLHQLRDQNDAAVRDAVKRAYALGLNDGKAKEPKYSFDQSKFEDVRPLLGPSRYFDVLNGAYSRGVQAGKKEVSMTAAKQRARQLGLEDGKIFGDFVRKNEMNDWPEVKFATMRSANNMDDDLLTELSQAYMAGYNEGYAPWQTLRARAHQLGRDDGKQRWTREHRDEMAKWPEVLKLITEGANPQLLYAQLFEAYDEAFGS